MRLKSIKLAGFKSFVDPTTVSFPTNLSCVVGPNGCGKSNIIDAVRWVMGESNAKQLRGESLTDVIFNGSGGRKPVAQASIELVFDNSDGSLGGEYGAFSEISIKRRVTKDSQSDYFLNGAKCRRRDITDIFLGTGLGPRSYAIIEQGMISNLIEAKPEELRVYIEEAAGISKYKERRRDTENRIRRTRENLERLTDIRDELERQLDRLKRQAAAAERYTEYKKEERLLKAQLNALHWRSMNAENELKKQAIDELVLKVEEQVTRQTHLESEIEKLIGEHTELGDVFNKIQARYYGLGAEIARAEQIIKNQQDRDRQLSSDLSETQTAWQEAEHSLSTDSNKLRLYREELTGIEPELALAREAEELSTEDLLNAEESMHEWQLRWDEFNQRAAAAQQRAEVQKSRIQHFEQVLQRLQERLEKLASEGGDLSAAPLEEEIAVLLEQIAELDLDGENLQQSLEAVVGQIQQKRDASQDLSTELDELRSALQSNRGRYASLEALQQAALGRKNAVVSEWIERCGWNDNPRLAESLQVESGFEIAVETVLGSHLQAICVAGMDAAASLVEGLEQGSLTLFDTQAAAQAVADRSLAEVLADKVSGAGHASDLLKGVYVVGDLSAALALRAQLQANESVVTRQGIWLGSNWLRVSKDADEQAGVLQRKQEIETLQHAIASQEQRVNQVSAAFDENQRLLREAEVQRDDLQRQHTELNHKRAEFASLLSGKQVKVEQITVRRQRMEAEMGDSRQQLQSEQEKLAEARTLLQSALDEMAQDASQREELLAERDNDRNALDEARQRARHDKDRAHQLALRGSALQAQLESLGSAIERTRRQVEQLQQRKNQLELSLAENSSPLDELKGELEAQLEKRLSVENQLNEARRNMEDAEHRLRDTEKQRNKTAADTQELRGRLESVRLDAQTLMVRCKGLEEQMAESNFDMTEVIANLPEGANEAKWEEDIQSIANRIQRLGAINLAAIDEFRMQSERKTYLDEQNNDLNAALDTLENAIRKIDRETRSRFKDTFDQVNAGLQELFPKVFGGGHAYLELTGDDLLDTGIAIMARPPGKRNSTIHLLSGGEKALTAIALVFSIFRLNPAPFCMLDEVDAPLDDANIARYARMVEEMSEKVQFIYITHNKIAMEMATQLIGVTMHEAGVSRMVNVDVDEAAELASA